MLHILGIVIIKAIGDIASKVSGFSVQYYIIQRCISNIGMSKINMFI